MAVDSMIQMIKHFYFSKVKRGNPLILSFDYIKTTSENTKNKSEWQIVGEMVDKFKRLIQRDVTVDGEPMIAMMTSVQSNRQGITTNRNSDNIVEDEEHRISFGSNYSVQLPSFLPSPKDAGRACGRGGIWDTPPHLFQIQAFGL